MVFSEGEPKLERMTVEQLVAIRQRIQDQLLKHPKDADYFNNYQRVLERALQELKMQKEKFQRVFVTEQGSIYFVIDTGQCLRFRKGATLFRDPEKKFWEMGEVTQKVIFLDEATQQYLRHRATVPKELSEKNVFTSALWKHPITHSDFALGEFPLELAIEGDPQVVDYKDDGKTLVVNGTINKKNGEKREGFPPFHFGHKITESLK